MDLKEKLYKVSHKMGHLISLIDSGYADFFFF